MSELKRRLPLSEQAAIYCEEHQVSDEEAANVFSLSPATIKQARYRLRIPMPGKTRSAPGVAVQAAKEYINSQMSLVSFVSEKGINKHSLTCALRRMGYSLKEDRPNRRLMHHKGMYYFRLRQTGKYVFKKLCNDLAKAREMRDKLERKYWA
jgi:hypothetical protein